MVTPWVGMTKRSAAGAGASPFLSPGHTNKDLHTAGVMDRVTLREFDQPCMPPVVPLKPQEIKRIREASHVSQTVCARGC